MPAADVYKRQVLQTGKDIGVKHIIADIVHGTLVQSLPVLATMVVGIGIFVLAVHTLSLIHISDPDSG